MSNQRGFLSCPMTAHKACEFDSITRCIGPVWSTSLHRKYFYSQHQKSQLHRAQQLHVDWLECNRRLWCFWDGLFWSAMMSSAFQKVMGWNRRWTVWVRSEIIFCAAFTVNIWYRNFSDGSGFRWLVDYLLESLWILLSELLYQTEMDDVRIL